MTDEQKRAALDEIDAMRDELGSFVARVRAATAHLEEPTEGTAP